NGRDYRGNMTFTSQGYPCQKWTSNYPNNITIDLTNELDGLGEHNFCRNPGGERERPWCYSLMTETEWGYCDLPLCSE
ncbi:hypothetical protein HELRODRAFT_138274, partial [Helobdella robusta]|uniref:Kringle domain-containing protein n=1 Tax=Helobdella robusta TaxID=6412 RepID=T1EIS4_HELRO